MRIYKIANEMTSIKEYQYLTRVNFKKAYEALTIAIKVHSKVYFINRWRSTDQLLPSIALEIIVDYLVKVIFDDDFSLSYAVKDLLYLVIDYYSECRNSYERLIELGMYCKVINNDEVLNFYKKIGKIQKEDPNKHRVEKVEEDKKIDSIEDMFV